MGEVDGGYEFTCQHGDDECYGNMVQACAQEHAPDYDTAVRLIVCMMSSPYPPNAGGECFNQFGLDYQPIQDCLDNGEAGALHAKNGEFQLSQEPRISWVPWVNFNGVSDPDVCDDAIENGLKRTSARTLLSHPA